MAATDQGRVHYEVFGRKGRKGAWKLVDAHPNREDAVKRADALLKENKATGVRVFKETYCTETGEYMTLRIHQGGDVTDLGSSLDRKEGQLPCFQPQDLYSIHARRVIFRVLKGHLGHNRITPIELIHRADALEKLNATDTVLQHAIQKWAVAHAGHHGQNVQEVVKHLQALIQKAIERVYKDTRAGIFPEIAGNRIDQAFDTAQKKGDTIYLFSGAIAHALADAKSWTEKLDLLIGFMNRLPQDAAKREECLNVLDAFFAEILQSGESLQAFAPVCNNLCEAIEVFTSLFLGKLTAEDNVGEGLAGLSACFSVGLLPETRSTTAQAVLNELRSAEPLCPKDMDAEVTAMRVLATKLVSGQGPFLPLEDIVEAFTLRSRRFVRPETIQRYLEAVESPGDKVEKLIDLEGNLVGDENKRLLADYVKAQIVAYQTEMHYLDESTPVTKRLADIAAVQKKIRKAAFRVERKTEMAEALGALAGRVADQGHLFAMIERRPVSSAKKTLILARMLEGGHLPDGPVTSTALVRIQRYSVNTDFTKSLQALATSSPEGRAQAGLIMKVLKSQVADKAAAKNAAAKHQPPEQQASRQQAKLSA